jgi:hypothetical protein
LPKLRLTAPKRQIKGFNTSADQKFNEAEGALALTGRFLRNDGYWSFVPYF